MPATRFDAPVGTADERLSEQLWPGPWIDTNPYGTRYTLPGDHLAYHTGADLNKPDDFHAPVYSVADGVVIFAQRVINSTWGNLLVVQHTLASGQRIYSRYAHLDTMLVQAGATVQRGDQIGTVGNAFGVFSPHLHFDISTTEKLKAAPGDWPGTDLTRLHTDYVDPLVFIRLHRVVSAEPVSETYPRTVTALSVCNLRAAASVAAAQVGQVMAGQQIIVVGTVVSGYVRLSGQNWWVFASLVR